MLLFEYVTKRLYQKVTLEKASEYTLGTKVLSNLQTNLQGSNI
jgi:hypothetical protein